MDSHSYDVAQRGNLLGLLAAEHEQRLGMFVNGLKNDSRWTEAYIDSVENKIRELLDSDTGGGNAVLSSREEGTLRLIAVGNTNKEIAERFDLSAKTIETYKTRALIKLGIKTRADIVQYARKRGRL